MQGSLRELADDSANAEHAYVTHDDVRSIPSFAPDTVIAIKAPSGTTLEVPDPDEGMEYPQRRYQIYLKSQSGPVEVFLVSQAEGEGGEAGEGSAAAAGEAAGAEAEGGRRSKRARGVEAGSPGRSRAGAEGGLVKLDPVGESGDGYWTAAAPAAEGEEHGVNDLFFSGAAS